MAVGSEALRFKRNLAAQPFPDLSADLAAHLAPDNGTANAPHGTAHAAHRPGIITVRGSDYDDLCARHFRRSEQSWGSQTDHKQACS